MALTLKQITIPLCLALITTTNLYAQEIRITGRVTDNDSLPLPNATIMLFRTQDSSFSSGTTTGDNGGFVLGKLRSDRYYLSVTALGYKNHIVPLSLPDTVTELSMGTLSVSRTSQSLNMVNFTARKEPVERRADKMIVNVKDNITSGGKSILDVLEKMPGVTVNKQTASISMNGRNGVSVTINGEPTYMTAAEVIQMLGGMSSNVVKEIELITVPSSNFDAEGGGGVINIVLNKNREYGMDGGININAGYGRKSKTGADLYFDYRRKKLQINSAYSVMRNSSKETWKNERESIFNNDTTNISTVSHRTPVTINHNFRTGIDYNATKRLSAGGYISVYQRTWKMDASNITDNIIRKGTSVLEDNEYNRLLTVTNNLYTKYRFSAGSELSINANYIYYKNTNDHQYKLTGDTDRSVDTSHMKKRTPLHIYVFKADYSGKINPNHSYGIGVKRTMSSFHNTITVDSVTHGISMVNHLYSSANELKENTSAVYGFLQSSVGDNLKIYLGLRYEHTSTHISDSIGNTIRNRKYGYFFPNVVITKTINYDNSIDISYNKRITRPSFNDLAPFILLLDPFTYYSGNDTLKPALTEAFKLDYRYKKYYLTLQYAYDKDFIAGFQPLIDEHTGQEIILSQNLNARKTFNTILTVPFKAGTWFSSQNVINYTWQQINSFYQHNHINTALNSIGFNSTNTFYLPQKYAVELSGYYQSSALNGVLKQDALGVVNIGFQKEFNNKSKIRITVDDIFKMNTRYIRGYQSFYSLKTLTVLNEETRIVRVSYAIQFGNNGTRKSKRSIGAEDEQNRTN